MARIGVYSIPNRDLVKPPAERLYRQMGRYNPETGEWDERTDGRVLLELGSVDGEYDIAELRTALSSQTFRVLYEDDVPGEVERAEPIVSPDIVDG